jgi:hypothetical protein
MTIRLLTLCCVLLCVAYACQLQDEIINTQSNLRLYFSVDTVKFDTIISKTKSQTKRLVVRNKDKNAVIVSNIRLGLAEKSPFTLVINGEKVNQKNNIRILGGDSILILLTANLAEKQQNLPILTRDSLLFETNSNTQHVKIWAWGQDVVRVTRTRISRPTVWTAEKPYLVSDTIYVDKNGTLTITEGTTIYASPNATILLEGKLTIQGSADKKVLLTGTRNDEGFANLAGQWNGIVFAIDSQGADINFAHIKNANFGLYAGIPDTDTLPDIVVKNTIIENMLATGIIAFNTDIVLQNTLISNCLERSIDARVGGHYTLQHCTIANYRNTIQKQPALRLQNFYTFNTSTGEKTDIAPLYVYIDNSIVWGDAEEEFEIRNQNTALAKFRFRNNLLKTAKPNEFGTNNQTATVFNFPLFESIGKQQFNLRAKSPAINAGLPLGIMNDLKGKTRDAQPDLGAYEN